MEEIDLKELLKEFWNKKILILSSIIISVVIIGVFSLIEKEKQNTFTASTTIVLMENQLGQEFEENNIIEEVNIIMALINSDIIIDEIKNKLDLDVKKENIIVTNDISNVLQIDVIDENKENAINVSNVIISKLMEKSFNVFKNNKVDIEVVNFPEKSCQQNITKNNLKLILGIIPIILSFGTVFILYIFDTRIKSKDKIEKELNINVIDELKLMKKENNSIENELTTIFDFKSENSKIFKIIVAKILNKINTAEQNVLLISSANSKEGKTYVASNIGTVLAMFGKKVIMLDTNFEESKLDKIFKVPNTLGLSNYLTGINGNGQEIKETLNNFIQETDIKNLNVITAGDVKENITNCLVSERFDEFIKQLKFYYDFIIIDSDKILNTPNSLILSNKSNSTIIVADKNTTKLEELVKVNNDIKEVDGNILGVILNETEKKNIIIEIIKNKKENFDKKNRKSDNKMLEEKFNKEEK